MDDNQRTQENQIDLARRVAAILDAWEPAPRILSDEEAHCLVEGVMRIAKAHGWLDQDRNIFEWLEQKLS